LDHGVIVAAVGSPASGSFPGEGEAALEFSAWNPWIKGGQPFG
jgi:hypothetical protein